MRQEAREKLESLGYKISEVQVMGGRTKTYVTHPQGNPSDPFAGQTLAWFDKLFDVFPDAVDPVYGVADDEYFDLDWEALPEEVRYEGIRVDNYRWLPDLQLQAQVGYDENGHELWWPWWAYILLLAAFSISVGVFFTMWSRHIQVVNAPCGSGTDWWINDCWKMVQAPDCSYRAFNSCANDGEGAWEGDWQKDIGEDWLSLIIIGAVAVVGVVLAINIIPKLIPEKKSQRYNNNKGYA